ncbi:MAG: sulfite exporter TauE/SafE family protein [Mailhella sp.]|nr:sulfite exporter TauE/SafE family protein [Mailhella sp.]
MDMLTLVAAASWFVGAFVNGLTGMGGALISLPIISMFSPSKEVIVISTIAGMQVATMAFILYFRHIRLRESIGFWIASLPGIPCGVMVLRFVDIEMLQLLLCFIIITHIVVQCVQEWLGTCMAPRETLKYLCGFVAGFFLGSIGVNGPILAIYASLMCMEKNTARGFFVLGFPTVFISLGMIAYNGMITETVVRSSLWVAPAALLGFWAAWPLAKKIRQETFRRALLILLGIAAATLFIRSMPYLMNRLGA